MIVDLFAGPGGWDTGLAMLNQDLRVVGIEWDRWACLTGHAAGHTRVRADVARFDPSGMHGAHLLIASPPCQAWSRSGKRKGILDQPAIFAHAMRVIAAGEWIDYTDAGPLAAGEGDEGGTWHDARSPLVLEVIRWVLAVQPANICLEQVPDVLPFWELIARWLRGQGYNVWAGCLSSERYGVPQTRGRAIVIASRERAVSAPTATHTAYESRLADGGKWHGTDGDLFGAGLEPWVSMAEALGWVPASVVNTRGDRKTSGGNEFSADRPSWALTEKTRSWVYRNGNQANAARRELDEPAPTVMFAERSTRFEWVLRTGQLSYQTGRTTDDLAEYTRPTDSPAPTVTAQVGAYWSVAPDDASRRRRPGNPESDAQAVRVAVQEAAVLQSFPADYPWQGTKSAQFRQVGDAVPPRLAAAVIGTCLGLDWQSAVAAHYAGDVAA